MNLDPEKLEPVLKKYGESLPHMPKWIGLVKQRGQFICSTGKFEIFPDDVPTDKELGSLIQEIAETNYASLEKIGHGNFQTGIILGGRGTLFILNLDDRFLLAVSYHGSGEGCCFVDLNETDEAIARYSLMIMNAIFL